MKFSSHGTNVEFKILSDRFHSERQPSSVRLPHLNITARHHPEGEEGHSGTVEPPHRNQRQVIELSDFIDYIIKCDFGLKKV